jgi:mycothiol synthase
VSDVQIRHAGPDDSAAIAGLCNALAASLYGEAEVSEDSIRHWFDLPDLTFWVAERAGRVVGYLDVRNEEAKRFEADARVHPDASGTGVADAVLDTAEAWSRERAQPGAVIRAYPGEREEELRKALERRGYQPVRHFFRMVIELGGPPIEVEDPPGFVLRAFDPETDDPARVYEAHMESFADHWGFHHTPYDEWRTYSLEGPHSDPTLWKLAEADDELAGFSLNSWHMSGDPTYGWVSVLGVRSPWRRKGLGLALLARTFDELGSRGATRVGLGVDTENPTGAVGLYERAGMSVSRRDDTYERAL